MKNAANLVAFLMFGYLHAHNGKGGEELKKTRPNQPVFLKEGVEER